MPDKPTPMVTITAAQMYDELREVRQAITRIEGKLDGIATINDQLDDHEQRLRHLESHRWPWPTITALAAVIVVVIAVWQNT